MEQTLKLRGDYKVNFHSDGENVIMEVFDSKGKRLDWRKFYHRDLTGEESKEDIKRSYLERGW